jgi:hypothetical protein
MLASTMLEAGSEAETLHLPPSEVVMSPIAPQQPQSPTFESDEEKWFSESGQQRKRPLKTSPTTPPPPLGDALADRWFR